MPAKPVASQVCNVAPCYTCYCDENNHAYIWRGYNDAIHNDYCVLVFVINGQHHLMFSGWGTTAHVCSSVYTSEANAVKRSCFDGVGLCYYWVNNGTCQGNIQHESATVKQYCEKRV